MKITSLLAALAVGAIALLNPVALRAELLGYYIGLDDRPLVIGGTYNGLPNPNFNSLSFLYAHSYPVGGVPNGPSSNHYHSKGTLVYTGPNLGAATAVIRSTSDFVPEGTLPPIKLSLGTGIYANKLITNPYTDPLDPVTPFSDLEIGSTQSLAGFGPTDGETYMFNSSSGRWDSPYNLAHLHIELISLTPGLNLGDATMLNVLSLPGDELHLTDPGTENESWGFTPVLWTDENAAPGIYEAKFRYFDEDGNYGSTGEVRIRTEVVPEPSTALLLLGGVGMMMARRRRSALA
jgi:hypothetical protein